MNATDPLVAKFYVRLALRRQARARCRMLDEGPRAAFRILGARRGNGRGRRAARRCTSIELVRDRAQPARAAADRVGAQGLRREHARARPPRAHDPVHDATGGPPKPEDGADLTSDRRARTNYWDRPYDGAWNLDARRQEPRADAAHLHQVEDGRRQPRRHDHAAPGRSSRCRRSTLDLHGLDYDLPLSATDEPLQLTLAEVHGDIDLVNEQGYDREDQGARSAAARSPARSWSSRRSA